MNTLTIGGAGFLSGSVVELVDASGARTAAQSVGIDSTTQITATFNLTGAAPGFYDVRVTLADGSISTKQGVYRVVPVPPWRPG